MSEEKNISSRKEKAASWFSIVFLFVIVAAFFMVLSFLNRIELPVVWLGLIFLFLVFWIVLISLVMKRIKNR